MIKWAESLLPSQRVSRKRMKETLRLGHVPGWPGPELGSFHTTRLMISRLEIMMTRMNTRQLPLRHHLHDGYRPWTLLMMMDYWWEMRKYFAFDLRFASALVSDPFSSPYLPLGCFFTFVFCLEVFFRGQFSTSLFNLNAWSVPSWFFGLFFSIGIWGGAALHLRPREWGKERIDDICIGGLRNICIPWGYCSKSGLKVHTVLVPYLELEVCTC